MAASLTAPQRLRITAGEIVAGNHPPPSRRCPVKLPNYAFAVQKVLAGFFLTSPACGNSALWWHGPGSPVANTVGWRDG